MVGNSVIYSSHHHPTKVILDLHKNVLFKKHKNGATYLNLINCVINYIKCILMKPSHNSVRFSLYLTSGNKVISGENCS